MLDRLTSISKWNSLNHFQSNQSVRRETYLFDLCSDRSGTHIHTQSRSKREMTMNFVFCSIHIVYFGTANLHFHIVLLLLIIVCVWNYSNFDRMFFLVSSLWSVADRIVARTIYWNAHKNNKDNRILPVWVLEARNFAIRRRRFLWVWRRLLRQYNNVYIKIYAIHHWNY